MALEGLLAALGPAPEGDSARGLLFTPDGTQEVTVWEQLANPSGSGTSQPLVERLGLNPRNNLPAHLNAYPREHQYQPRNGVYVPNRYLDEIYDKARKEYDSLMWRIYQRSVLGFIGEPQEVNQPPIPKSKRETPAIGYRRWTVNVVQNNKGDMTEALLMPEHTLGSGPWKSGAPSYFSCLCDTVSPLHKLPTEKSRCGFYFYKRPQDAIPDGLGRMVVSGAVMAWGKIIEHRDGFRSEWAQPIALMLVPGNWHQSLVTKAVAGILDLPVVPAGDINDWIKEHGDYLDSVERKAA